MSQPLPPSPVAELEARQDDVIRQLDELNTRIEQLLREYSSARPSDSEAADNAEPPLRQAA